MTPVCDCELGMRPEGCSHPHCPVAMDEIPESLCSRCGIRPVEIQGRCESCHDAVLDDWVRYDDYDPEAEW